MLTVCTSSTDADYATTGDVMQVLFGSTSTAVLASTGDKDYLGALVRRASAWAESYVGRPLGLAVYAESLAAYGDGRLLLSRTPVRAVLRLFDSTATCEATAYCSTDYRVEDAEAGLLARDGGFGWSADFVYGAGDFSLGLTGAILPGRERRPWLVEYVAGYAPLGGVTTSAETWSTAGPNGATTTASTLPDDVRAAVVVKAAELYSNPFGVTSRRVGDLAVDYRSEGGSRADQLLAPYRRLA